MSLHNDLAAFLSGLDTSKFPAYTGASGGYITFENTGKPIKAFTLSLESILSGLSNIESNIGAFREHTLYSEKEWRDLGGRYFVDTALKSISTVQTKPLFSTFSKIISWANGQDYVDDNHINLDTNALTVTKELLLKLIKEYNPKTIQSEIVAEQINSSFPEILRENSLREFALQVFSYFYGLKWKEVLDKSTSSDSSINNINFKSYKFESFTRLIAEFDSEQDREKLISSNTQRFFVPPVYKEHGKYYYFSTQWNGNGEHSLSFDNLKTFFELKYPKYTIIKDDGYFLLLKNTFNSLPSTTLRLPKPFILLSGISGTGKTRFVKQQALNFSADGSNYCLVAVRPDWHEPSDLLGYVSRLGSNGTEYIVTDFLRFMVAAWKEVILAIDDSRITYNQQAIPYWLCLDEMNLAPVEQYFADYLSVIESRHWENGHYHCEPMLNASIFSLIAEPLSLRKNLGLDGDEHDDLWAHFVAKGISIPPNLIVAGTVNMDETTHGFSRKVIDRAFTLDFGEFFPNDYQAYFNETTKIKALSYPMLSSVNESDLVDYDAKGSKSITFLESINSVLKSTPFELAYRALNELLLAVVCFQPKNDHELQAIWDDFLMTKVLPRMEGDGEKLQDNSEQNLLDKLAAILAAQLNDIWGDEPSRPDLLREGTEGSTLTISCRSKKKINWMQNRLRDNGFTSFWP